MLIHYNNLSSNETSSNSSSFSTSEDLDGYDYKISKKDYYDKVYAGIQAELWGNFTGLPLYIFIIKCCIWTILIKLNQKMSKSNQ